MALYILQPGLEPLGQFDFLDTDIASVLGGDFGVFAETAGRANTATETAAQDVFDGYVNNLIDAGTDAPSRPLLQLADGTDGAVARYLLDDGIANYGTLFGSVLGGLGLDTTGTALGPHSATGSGKVTAWDKPGIYAVSTDALDADVVPTTGNVNDTPLPGESLYCGAATAQLTRVDAGLGYKVATFIELRGSGSLVTTPARLVGATEVFDRIVIQYLGAMHCVSQ
jgi:hypothetical protein